MSLILCLLHTSSWLLSVRTPGYQHRLTAAFCRHPGGLHSLGRGHRCTPGTWAAPENRSCPETGAPRPRSEVRRHILHPAAQASGCSPAQDPDPDPRPWTLDPGPRHQTPEPRPQTLAPPPGTHMQHCPVPRVTAAQGSVGRRIPGMTCGLCPRRPLDTAQLSRK